MSNHEVISDEIIGNRYTVTCACGRSYEDEASQYGSDHIWNQMQGHLLGTRSRGRSGASESLSVWEAADIWRSNGMDEDYMFGYSEDELRRA